MTYKKIITMRLEKRIRERGDLIQYNNEILKIEQ